MQKVTLKVFEDQATGSFGFAHYNALDFFNAFYDGIGIFHDVFEHNHEDNNKYFLGKNSFNIGGEIAAMGACCYYWENIGSKREFRRSHYFPKNMSRTITDLMVDAVSYGYLDFGATLESGIPRQGPVKSYHLEELIELTLDEIQTFSISSDCDEDSKHGAINFKKSLKESKIKNLYRWGYRNAKKTSPSPDCLHKFIDFFDSFTQKIEAEALLNADFSTMVIKYDKNGWNGRLKSFRKDIFFNQKTSIYDIEDKLYKD